MVFPQPIGQSTSVSVASGTSAKIARPNNNYEEGDFILFAIRSQSSNATGITCDQSVTRLGPAFVANSAAYRFNALMGYRVDTISQIHGGLIVPFDFTFTFTGSSSSRIVIIAQHFRNVANDPFSSFYNSYWGELQQRGVRIPSYANVGDGTTVVMAASEFAANNSEVPTLQDNDYGVYGQVVAPAALTSGRTSVGLYAREVSTADTNEFIMSWGTPSGQAAESVTLRGGVWTRPGAGVTGARGEIAQADGSIVPIEFLASVNGTLVGTDRVLMGPPGPITTRQWLDNRPSLMIHRGGSVDYAEHTLQAYTNAVWLGAKALEASIWYSIDDEPFICHDPTLTSITGGVDNRRIDAMTAAQLDQVVVNQPNKQGNGEKLMRLSLLQEKYGRTHILVLEDKSYNHMTQMVAFMDRNGGPERFIVKANGGGGTGHMTLPNSKGYYSWGYFYTKNAAPIPPETVPDKARLYTTIGIEWDSTQEAYTAALSLGIPLLVHIVPSAAAAQTARDRGGANVGMQISSPLSVLTPRMNEPLA